MLKCISLNRLTISIYHILLSIPCYLPAQFPFHHSLVYSSIIRSQVYHVSYTRNIHRTELLYLPSYVSVKRIGIQHDSVHLRVRRFYQSLLHRLQSQCLAIVIVSVVTINNAYAISRNSHNPLAHILVYYKTDLTIMNRDVKHHNVIMPNSPYTLHPERFQFLSMYVKVIVRIDPCTHKQLIHDHLIPRLQRWIHGICRNSEIVKHANSHQQP